MPNQNNLGMPIALKDKKVKSPRNNQNPLDSNGFENSISVDDSREVNG